MAQGPHEKIIFADDLLRDLSTIIRALLQSEPWGPRVPASAAHYFSFSSPFSCPPPLRSHAPFFFSSPLPFFCGEGENILLKTSILANKLRDKITTLTHPKTIN